jgi:hypothetical protein
MVTVLLVDACALRTFIEVTARWVEPAGLATTVVVVAEMMSVLVRPGVKAVVV